MWTKQIISNSIDYIVFSDINVIIYDGKVLNCSIEYKQNAFDIDFICKS